MILDFYYQNVNYPIVRIPEEILNSMFKNISEDIIANELKITKPALKSAYQRPDYLTNYRYEHFKKLNLKYNKNASFIATIYLIFLLFNFQAMINVFTGILALFSLISVFVDGLPFKIKEEYASKKIILSPEEYNLKIRQHDEILSNYYSNIKDEKLKYDAEINKFNSTINKNYSTIQKIIFQRSLKPSINASRTKISQKKGVSEFLFLEKLVSEFKDQIYVDMVPQLNYISDKTPYNPDFTFICAETSLHIDIEIDEPYTLKDNTPIHYIGSRDEERNDFFLAINWCIIRFSEKQIIENSAGCIETIKSIHSSLLQMKVEFISHINLDETWTYEQATIMVKNRHRQTYL